MGPRTRSAGLGAVSREGTGTSRAGTRPHPRGGRAQGGAHGAPRPGAYRATWAKMDAGGVGGRPSRRL